MNSIRRSRFAPFFLLVAALASLSPHFLSAACEETEAKVVAGLLRLTARGDAAAGDVAIVVEDAIIVSPHCAAAAVGAALELLPDEADVAGAVVKSAVEIAPKRADEIVKRAIAAAPKHEAVIRQSKTEGLAAPRRRVQAKDRRYAAVTSFDESGEKLESSESHEPQPRVTLGALVSRRLAEFAEAGAILLPQPATAIEPGFRAEVTAGFDSNRTTSSGDGEESAYARGGLTAGWESQSGPTEVSAGLSFGVTQFFESEPGVDELFYDANGRFFAEHRLNSRISLSDRFEFGYGHEPDLLSGVATAGRTGQYRQLFNRVALAFQAAENLETTLSYAINQVEFDEEPIARSDDRFSHLIGAMVKRRLGSKTALSGAYRYADTNYRRDGADFRAHYAIAGIEHEFSPQLRADLGAGAELRRYDRGDIGRESSPFVESRVDLQLNAQTRLRLINRYGFDDRELALLGFDTRQSYRAGLEATVDLMPKASLTGKLSYLRSDFHGASRGLGEDAVFVSLDGRYQLAANLYLVSGYAFGAAISGQDERDYDRHRVWTGLSGTF